MRIYLLRTVSAYNLINISRMANMCNRLFLIIFLFLDIQFFKDLWKIYIFRYLLEIIIIIIHFKKSLEIKIYIIKIYIYKSLKII